MSEREAAQHMIFLLRQKEELHLFANNSAEVNRIQQTIAHLQSIFKVTSGIRREKDERTA